MRTIEQGIFCRYKCCLKGYFYKKHKNKNYWLFENCTKAGKT